MIEKEDWLMIVMAQVKIFILWGGVGMTAIQPDERVKRFVTVLSQVCSRVSGEDTSQNGTRLTIDWRVGLFVLHAESRTGLP